MPEITSEQIQYINKNLPKNLNLCLLSLASYAIENDLTLDQALSDALEGAKEDNKYWEPYKKAAEILRQHANYLEIKLESEL